MDCYDAEFKKLGIKYDAKILTAVAKGCGPTIYKADASKVSSSDKAELERVKKNFVMKKLGITDEEKINAGMADVVAKFGKGNRNKYRAMFYYLLVKRFRKSGLYK